MEVIKKSSTPQGYILQIEDWSKDYPEIYTKNDVVAVYPIAKASSEYKWILAGNTFRCMFHFQDQFEAETVFLLLQKGMKKVEDFSEYTDMRTKIYLLGD